MGGASPGTACCPTSRRCTSWPARSPRRSASAASTRASSPSTAAMVAAEEPGRVTADAELTELAWVRLDAARKLDLPYITRAILDDLEPQIAAEFAPAPGDPLPLRTLRSPRAGGLVSRSEKLGREARRTIRSEDRGGDLGGRDLRHRRRHRIEPLDSAPVDRAGAARRVEHADRAEHRGGGHRQHLHGAVRAAARGADRRRAPCSGWRSSSGRSASRCSPSCRASPCGFPCASSSRRRSGRCSFSPSIGSTPPPHPSAAAS